MAIAELDHQQVLELARRTIGLEPGEPDDQFFAALLRRSAGIHCPCSRATLRTSVLECLRYLSDAETPLSDRTDSIIEALIVGGDLLELHDIVTEDSHAKGTWVFAAPPSFVVRPNGSVFVFGIVPEQDTFLPHTLASRIVYQGFTRLIRPEPGEALQADLQDLGLQRLSEAAWLRCPRAQPAESFVDQYRRRLTEQEPSGSVSDLQILDPDRPVTYYRGRWITPSRQSGMFVARRPQEYGSPIWGLAALEDGNLVRFLDFPLENTRWRGCDAAWHLQMAIDHCRGAPQLYRRNSISNGVRMDFFSPLPQWAERRLMIFGRPLPREQSLLSYWLPAAEAATEENFLCEHLWMSVEEPH